MRQIPILLCAMLLLAAPGEAGLIAIGGGAFLASSTPFLQDDAKESGKQFGIRVPVKLLPLISFEPFFSSTSLGDTHQDYNGVMYTRDGFSIRAFGLNAALGSLVGRGVSVYPFGGIGSYKLTRTGSSDIKETGYSGGLGVGFSPGPVRIDVRGEAVVVVTGDTSRKFANLSAGVSYRFWPR